MKNYLSFHKAKLLICLTGLLFTISSCDYQDIEDASFPPESVYLSTAALVKKGPDANGLYTNAIYRFNNIEAINPVPKYTVDLGSSKFNILMGVQRAGVTSKGSVNVNLTLDTDTITLLKSKGILTAATEVLPKDKILIPATVQIADQSNSSIFNFGVDLAFLKSNPNKTYAIGLTIISSDRTVTSDLKSVIVLINTNILVPSADFTSTLNAATKTVSLVNSSLNWVNYTWNFGDGSPAITTDLTITNNNNRVLPAITKTYAPGTYTITLTAVGLPLVNGQINQSVKTMTVVIP
ncbi:DUF1735 domain-containing protein [Pedobacter petrophilus]|uniref:DUF1735 domain-containing protein n=2 Tax=Pedobacter TaxID=84567 RepID=A0A7K0G4V1_9SPHI|nr:DUF1735 domain-containing protein [Pedobacter petrophilus]MRX78016.1 DUF1735 domain-containing protein [Pedobacter petrophilus]